MNGLQSSCSLLSPLTIFLKKNNQKLLFIYSEYTSFSSVVTRWWSQNPAVRTCYPPETHPLQHGGNFYHSLSLEKAVPLPVFEIVLEFLSSQDTICFPLFFSLQYLSCLTTSRSLTDKLAFDVGLQEDSTGCFAF